MQPQPDDDATDILFVGGVFPRDEEAYVYARSKGSVDAAANALQWNLIAGLDALTRAPVSLLNAMFVRPYPKFHRDAWIRGRRWSHAPGAQDESIGFLNLFGIRNLWRACALIGKARRWAAARATGSQRTIILYSMHTPFILAGAAAKRVDGTVKLCLVVPDLPEHMHPGEKLGGLFAWLKRVDRRVMNHFMEDVDCFVLLTRHMAGPLDVGGRPWIVAEGVVNPDEVPRAPARIGGGTAEKVILYTGTLSKAYGILELLEAFSRIADPSYRLWICGAGEAEREVRDAATRDSRVCYRGQVSRDEALALQQQATVLVNPRGDTGEYTRFSFPSKIMEYMLSGTPTIVRRLSGMPEEYFDYLFVVDGAAPADLARAMVEVCSLPAGERARLGERARRFVVGQKNARAQAERILELVGRAGSMSPNRGRPPPRRGPSG